MTIQHLCSLCLGVVKQKQTTTATKQQKQKQQQKQPHTNVY
jgi:hypothetical protein